MLRILVTSALAGVGSAMFAIIVAHMIDVSRPIAGIVSGVLAAAIVPAVMIRYRDRRPND